MKCITNSYTSLGEPSLQPQYATNPSFTRTSEYHMGIYIKGVTFRRQEVIRVLLYRQTNAIIDVKLGNSNADTYRFEQMVTLLDCRDKMIKDKHGKHCQEKRKHFSLFVLSADGMLRREALAIIQDFSWLMVAKMDEPILHLRGWITDWIKITIVRSYSCMIRRTRLPNFLQELDQDWDQHWALGWHNKFRSIMTLRAHLQTICFRQC